MSCSLHPQWIHDSEDCPFCVTVPVKEKRLLSDRIQEFIDWLAIYTDFGEDHMDVIHKKLIECMISDPVEEEKK